MQSLPARRALIWTLCMLAVVLLASPTSAAAGTSRASYAPEQVLIAGHSVRQYGRLETPQRFFLYVDPGAMELDQDLKLSRVSTAGLTVFSVRDVGRGGRGPTSLTMRRNGNLVLHDADGHVIWATGTAGTGRHNRAVLTNTGSLRVLAGDGTLVWASQTTPVGLGPGRSLRPGTTWRSERDLNDPGARSSLTMRRNGDAVLRRGSRTLWRSHTRSPGARLVMRRFGNLAVVGVHGHTLWQSHTGGHSKPAYLSLCFGNMQVDGEGHAVFGVPYTTPSC